MTLKGQILPSLRKLHPGKNVKQKLFLYFIFVLVASLFWLLSVLNKVYYETIEIPVHYANMPKGRVLSGNSTDVLQLRVSAPGYKLLQFQLSEVFSPFVFDFREQELVKNGPDRYYLLTGKLEKQLGDMLGSDITITRIVPDSLIFHFTKTSSKRVAVRPQVEITPASQHMVNGKLQVIPDSIRIRGPKAMLDTLKEIYTRPISRTGMTGSFDQDVPLIAPDKIILERSQARVILPIDKYTQRVISQNILVDNLPDSLDMKVIPGQVEVSFHVALGDFNKISPESFRFIADYQDTKLSLSNKIPVKMTKQPEFVKNISFTPRYTEFIIEK